LAVSGVKLRADAAVGYVGRGYSFLDGRRGGTGWEGMGIAWGGGRSCVMFELVGSVPGETENRARMPRRMKGIGTEIVHKPQRRGWREALGAAGRSGAMRHLCAGVGASCARCGRAICLCDMTFAQRE
jgi:hypothetical protein